MSTEEACNACEWGPSCQECGPHTGHAQPPELLSELVALRADLDRANEHNRNLMAAVNQQSKVVTAAKDFIKAPRCVRPFMSDSHATCIRGGEPCDLYYWHLLKHSLAELDKAQQPAEPTGGYLVYQDTAEAIRANQP